jgi:hypothetical protein
VEAPIVYSGSQDPFQSDASPMWVHKTEPERWVGVGLASRTEDRLQDTRTDRPRPVTKSNMLERGAHIKHNFAVWWPSFEMLFFGV